MPRRGRAGEELHSFRRLDYVLGSDKAQGLGSYGDVIGQAWRQGQDAVFYELRAMLPSASPGQRSF